MAALNSLCLMTRVCVCVCNRPSRHPEARGHLSEALTEDTGVGNSVAGSPLPLSTGNDSLDMAIVIHLQHCNHLIQVTYTHTHTKQDHHHSCCALTFTFHAGKLYNQNLYCSFLFNSKH